MKNKITEIKQGMTPKNILSRHEKQNVNVDNIMKESVKHQERRLLSHVQLFVTPRTIDYRCPLSMESPGKNTELDSHPLLEGNLLTQGSNLGFQHCRQIFFFFYCLKPPGKPMTRKWIKTENQREPKFTKRSASGCQSRGKLNRIREV